MCGPGDEILEMIDDDNQNQELQKLTDEILKDAKSVVIDYKENPSEVGGSMIQIHQDSPHLTEE